MGKTVWSWSTGERGATVRVFERAAGGVLYLAAFDPTLADGKGGLRRRSLGHRDRARARKEATRVSALLADDGASLANPTLGYVLDLYRHHELVTKRPATAKWLRSNLAAWEEYLGRSFRIRAIAMREWEGFKRARRAGTIDGRGRLVPAGTERPVAPGTVNLGLDALSIALNWAVRWRVDGRPVLERSPVWRFPYADDVNPQRAIWTHDRYEAILVAAEALRMQVEWRGRRERLPCHLAAILAIAEGTGRRIGAVRQLRVEDIRLTEGPHGKVRWPSDTDKGGKTWTTPITPAVRARLLTILRHRQAIGKAPLFPAPRDASRPVDRETLAHWLRQAEKAAGLPRLGHDSFHGVRRKWVTERKHLPDVDVARAGGWRSVQVMKRAYQQADEVGVLDAVLSPRRLRDKGGA